MKQVVSDPVSQAFDYHANVRRDIFPLVTQTGGVLVDIGGGMGNTAAQLKAQGKAARAGVVDLFKPAQSNPDLDFALHGDIESPAFLDEVVAREGPFTTILCLDVLEHLVDPWTVVKRLHRALVPGGILVASLPNVRHYSALAPLLLKNQWQLRDSGILDRTHLRFFVRESAVELLTGSGLTLEAVEVNRSSGWKVDAVRRASLGLLDSFFVEQYLLRVRRPPAEAATAAAAFADAEAVG